MKTRTSHLVYLLLWLVVLAAYVTALSYLPQGPNLLMILPAGLGSIAAAQEWSDFLGMKKRPA